MLGLVWYKIIKIQLHTCSDSAQMSHRIANRDSREASSTRWGAGRASCGCTPPCCRAGSPCPQTAGPGPGTAAWCAGSWSCPAASAGSGPSSSIWNKIVKLNFMFILVKSYLYQGDEMDFLWLLILAWRVCSACRLGPVLGPQGRERPPAQPQAGPAQSQPRPPAQSSHWATAASPRALKIGNKGKIDLCKMIHSAEIHLFRS